MFVLTGWKYSKGFVSDTMIKEHLPAPGDDTLIVMCGPPPMIKFACLPNLDKLGYSESQRFAYWISTEVTYSRCFCNIAEASDEREDACVMAGLTYTEWLAVLSN